MNDMGSFRRNVFMIDYIWFQIKLQFSGLYLYDTVMLNGQVNKLGKRNFCLDYSATYQIIQ